MIQNQNVAGFFWIVETPHISVGPHLNFLIRVRDFVLVFGRCQILIGRSARRNSLIRRRGELIC